MFAAYMHVHVRGFFSGGREEGGVGNTHAHMEKKERGRGIQHILQHTLQRIGGERQGGRMGNTLQHTATH